MTQTVTNELLYEVLKHIQADVADLKKSDLQSDALRQEAMMAVLRADVDTIKRRLNLVEA